MDRIKVIYIASMGHSGSTLLDVMLNQHAQFQSVGEVAFYDEWVTRNYLCSCGSPVRKCPFWIDASAQVHGSSEGDLLLGVAKSTGSKIIIDSSKSLQRYMALKSDPRLDVKLVHLVRNGLAVVNSLRKAHDRPGTDGRLKTPVTPLWKGILRWARRNRAYDRTVADLATDEVLRVRYEDLCMHPEETLKVICALVGVDLDEKMMNPSTKDLHNIAGSRWRFTDESVRVNLDDKWRSEVNLSARLLFRLLAGSLNRGYGYSE